MKGAWPKVDASRSRSITIYHSLPRLGNACPHAHDLIVRLGWSHEINPSQGHTWPLAETDRVLEEQLKRIDGKDLDGILPLPPTAEVLACWLLSQFPPCYDWLEVEAYNGYKVRANRVGLRSEWIAFFRGEGLRP